MRTYPAPPVSFYRHYYRLRNSEVRGEPGHTRAHTGAHRHTDDTDEPHNHPNPLTIVLPDPPEKLAPPCSLLQGLHGRSPLMRLCRTVGLRRARDLFGPGSGGLGWGEGA